MSNQKLTPKLKTLILREKKKAPYLSSRKLALILANKYNIKLSKSTIHNLLKNKGVKEKPGRKKAYLPYRARIVAPCGLMLLRALDSQIGLFDCLTDQLKKYFPKIKLELFNKLIILASFSFLLDKKSQADLRKSGFLRLIGLRQLPSRTISYFNQTIANKNPIIDLTQLKQDLQTVSAVKFYFQNRFLGFSDARLSTFWEKAPKLEDFSLSLKVCRQRLKKMLDQNLIVIGYTRSFNYLSRETINFLEGLNSGLVRIEFLTAKGEVVDQLKPSAAAVSFVFGYSPQIFSPTLKSRSGKFKRFLNQQLGEFFLSRSQASFQPLKQREEISLDNIEIKKGLSSVSWGLLASLSSAKKTAVLANCLTEYLYLWPYIIEDFFKEIEVAQGQASFGKNKANLAKMLPKKLVLLKPIDFVRVGQILSILFKELVGGWEPRHKSGTYSLRKGYVKITLKQAPAKLKRAFNQLGFYIDNRRAFLD